MSEIIAHGADVVLMDQGLDALEGDKVVTAVKQATTKPPRFIANTSGSDYELRKVGAMENCNKGQNLRSLRVALS